MKNQHKILFGGVAFFIFFGLFAFFYHFQKEGVYPFFEQQSPHTQVGENSISGSNTHSGGETWGNSPFSSGAQAPLVFKKPNLEWKTRTLDINGKKVTYEFGKGNPPEVAELSKKEKEAYDSCENNEDLAIISCGKMGEEVFGYVRPDIEKDLLALISSPLWESVLTNCATQFRQNEYPDWGATYDQVMQGDFMNMENMLTISSWDNRKSLSDGNFLHLQSWLNNALRERRNVMGRDTLKINNCITQHGGFELYRMMDVIYQKRFHPFWNYPERITDPKKYIPWY